MCDPSVVQAIVRVLAACAAFCFAPLPGAAEPLIVFPMSRAEAVVEKDLSISVTIPKYALTQTEREVVAACLVLEAANQGEFGMRSVMAVIRNRARGLPELFASAVLRPKQFTALNPLTSGRESFTQTLRRAKRDRTWDTALAIVDAAAEESWHDPTEGATHYIRSGERNRWTMRLAKTVTIGSHSFYR